MGDYATDINEPERADAYYRFSVKCDRATNAKIEGAARKAGVSATTFVQRHFETILKSKTAAPKADAAFDAKAFASCNGISVTAARVWFWLHERADDMGEVTVSLMQISTVVGGASTTNSSRYRNELVDAGMIEQLGRSNGPAGTTYRVIGEM